MRTIIFPFPSEFEQETEADRWRSEEGGVIALQSYPLDKVARKPMEFDFREFVRFLIGKVQKTDSVRLVFGMSSDKARIGEISGEIPCRLEIVIKDCFGGDKILRHDGSGLEH